MRQLRHSHSGSIQVSFKKGQYHPAYRTEVQREGAMKPRQFIEILAIALIMLCLWGLARCVLDPVEAWPTMERPENTHGEHLSHWPAYASASLRPA